MYTIPGPPVNLFIICYLYAFHHQKPGIYALEALLKQVHVTALLQLAKNASTLLLLKVKYILNGLPDKNFMKLKEILIFIAF